MKVGDLLWFSYQFKLNNHTIPNITTQYNTRQGKARHLYLYSAFHTKATQCALHKDKTF